VLGKSGNEIAIVSIGSCDGAVREAIRCARAQEDSCRLPAHQGISFGLEVEGFLSAHARIFIVEQNRDAQLRSLLTLETAVEKAKLHSILSYSGAADDLSTHCRRYMRGARRRAATVRDQTLKDQLRGFHVVHQ